MMVDRSLAQNRTTRAMSSGVPMRPMRLFVMTAIAPLDSVRVRCGRGHVAFGGHEGRCDAEHTDSERSEFERHLLRHASDGVFGSDVGRESWRCSCEPGGRDDVDDDSPVARRSYGVQLRGSR